MSVPLTLWHHIPYTNTVSTGKLNVSRVICAHQDSLKIPAYHHLFCGQVFFVAELKYQSRPYRTTVVGYFSWQLSMAAAIYSAS